jgi:hypothetical protein
MFTKKWLAMKKRVNAAKRERDKAIEREKKLTERAALLEARLDSFKQKK